MIPFIAFHSLLDLKTTFGVRMAIAGVPPPFKDKESLVRVCVCACVCACVRVRANVWRRLKNCSNLFPPWLSNTISCHSLSYTQTHTTMHTHTLSHKCTHTHILFLNHQLLFPRLLPTLLLFWPHSQCFIWSFCGLQLSMLWPLLHSFFLGERGFLAVPGRVEL